MRDHRKLRAFESADEGDLLTYRESQAEYLRFLEIAFGSLRELHDRLGLSKRLGYSYEREFSTCETKFVGAGKVLGALLRSMRG
ncbi:MAG: four helix bundle protein [Desulfatiglandales bacterium]